MASVTVLYTPEVLMLAASLADFPLIDALSMRGRARSPVCGSSLILGLACDHGHVTQIGLTVSACAIGQASAALFARGVPGRSHADIAGAEQAITRWLDAATRNEVLPLPDWPGLATIAAAAAYPGRHGAILLAWRAALMAFQV